MKLQHLALLVFFLAIAHEAFGCGGGGGGKKGTPKPTGKPTAAPTPKPDDNKENNNNNQEPKEDPDPSDPSKGDKEDVSNDQPKNPNSDDEPPEGEPGEAKSPEDLKCSAGDDSCCWSNEASGDQLDFQKGDGLKPEVAALLKQGGVNIPPNVEDSKYFFTGTTGGGSEQSAMFKSCKIACVDPEAKIMFEGATKYGDAKLQICSMESGSSGPVENCGDIEIDESGKAEGTLANTEPLQNVQLVIQAVGFSSVGLAAFEGISADYTSEECPESTTPSSGSTSPQDDATSGSPTDGSTSGGEETTPEETTTPSEETTPPQDTTPKPGDTTPKGSETTTGKGPAGNGAEDDPNDQKNCEAIKCSDKESCGEWPTPKDVPGKEEAKITWKDHSKDDGDAATTPMHNPLTGVQLDDPYRGIYVYPGEGGAQATNDLDITKDRILEWESYERTKGVVLKVCRDQQCSDELWKTVEDRAEWHDDKVLLPAGTKKVWFVVENEGDNQGAVGIKKLKLAKPKNPSDPNSDEPGEDVCPSPAQRAAARRLKVLAARRLKVQRAKALRKARRLQKIKNRRA